MSAHATSAHRQGQNRPLAGSKRHSDVLLRLVPSHPRSDGERLSDRGEGVADLKVEVHHRHRRRHSRRRPAAAHPRLLLSGPGGRAGQVSWPGPEPADPKRTTHGERPQPPPEDCDQERVVECGAVRDVEHGGGHLEEANCRDEEPCPADPARQQSGSQGHQREGHDQDHPRDGRVDVLRPFGERDEVPVSPMPTTAVECRTGLAAMAILGRPRSTNPAKPGCPHCGKH